MLMPTKSPWAPSLLGPGNAGLGQVQSLNQRRAPSSSRLPVMPLLPLQVTLRAAILVGTDIGAHPELGTVPGAEAGREDSNTHPCGKDIYA